MKIVSFLTVYPMVTVHAVHGGLELVGWDRFGDHAVFAQVRQVHGASSGFFKNSSTRYSKSLWNIKEGKDKGSL